MNILNLSLSGTNINKTYENVLHHNTTNWYGDNVYKLYTGNGIILPISFEFINGTTFNTLQFIPNTIFTLQHIKCNNCDNIKDLQNLYIHNISAITNTITCSARNILNNTVFPDEIPSTPKLLTNTDTHIIANYKYLDYVGKQLSAYYDANFDYKTRYKNKLIYGYVNKTTGNCNVTIKLTPNDIAKSNNTITLLVFAQGNKKTGDSGHTLTLNLSSGDDKISTSTWLRSYLSSDRSEGGHPQMNCYKNGVMMLYKTIKVVQDTYVNIWVTNCDTSSLVVLRGDIATE